MSRQFLRAPSSVSLYWPCTDHWEFSIHRILKGYLFSLQLLRKRGLDSFPIQLSVLLYKRFKLFNFYQKISRVHFDKISTIGENAELKFSPLFCLQFVDKFVVCGCRKVSVQLMRSISKEYKPTATFKSFL